MTSLYSINLSHQHEVQVFEYPVFRATSKNPPFIIKNRLPTIIRTGRYIGLPVATNKLSFNRLELLLSIAHAILLKVAHDEIYLEIQGLSYSIGRYLKDELELGFKFPDRKAHRGSRRIPLVDYRRTTLNGDIGNGIAGLYARSKGILYIAHFEDVKNASDINYNHKLYNGVSGKNLNGSPDFITVNDKGAFGVLEAKSSQSDDKSSVSFLTDPVLKALREQVDTYVDGKISLKTGSAAQAISYGLVSGTKISDSGSRSQLHICEIQSAVPYSPTLRISSMSTLHFMGWIHLFGEAFWSLSPSKKGVRSAVPIIDIGASRFIILPIHNFTEVARRYRHKYLRYLECMYFCGNDIIIGIEENIFNSIIEIGRDNITSMSSGEDLHSAVLRYRENEFEAVRSSLNSAGNDQQERPWSAAAAFQEGIIAFYDIDPRYLINIINQ